MSDDLVEQKAVLRKGAAERRKAAHSAGAAAADEATARFLEAIAVPAGLEVSAYRPIRSEIDPTPLMRALHGGGARLSVPVIVGAAPLEFRRWTPDCRMIAGPFGAEVPENGERVRPSLFITPLLAFDRAGGRLGYGGGHYDRTFQAARAARPICAVALAYAAQETPETPQEPTDQKLDAVVTEREAVIFNASVMALCVDLL